MSGDERETGEGWEEDETEEKGNNSSAFDRRIGGFQHVTAVSIVPDDNPCRRDICENEGTCEQTCTSFRCNGQHNDKGTMCSFSQYIPAMLKR